MISPTNFDDLSASLAILSMDRIWTTIRHCYSKLNQPMNFCEFYRVMAPTIAAIKCGHTGLGLPQEIRAEIDAQPWLPFDVKVLDSRVYIFRDYAKQAPLN
jgi:hypothetical protein